MLSECFLFEINVKLFVKHFYQNANEKKKKKSPRSKSSVVLFHIITRIYGVYIYISAMPSLTKLSNKSCTMID